MNLQTRESSVWGKLSSGKRLLLAVVGLLTIGWQCATGALASPASHLSVPIVGAVNASCSPLDNTAAMTLSEAVAAGKVTMQVIGDGSTTSHVQLRLHNKTGQPIFVTIPRFQVLVPKDSSHQLMLVTQQVCLMLRPGAEATTQVTTLCISGKTVKPPGPSTVYAPGDYPNPQEFTTITHIVETAEKLGGNGAYDGLLISEARRTPTITQLSIWMFRGKKSSKPEDQVTPESIGEVVLQAAQTTREALTPEQKKAFDEGVNAIFAKADFTLKRSLQSEETADTPNAGELISDDPPKAPSTTEKPDPKPAEAKQPTATTADNGDLVLTYPDGTKVTIKLGKKNIERSEERPDGIIAYFYFDGTRVSVNPKTKARVIRLADGTLVREFPAGEGKPPLVTVQSPVVKTLPDGTRITTEPDGTTRTRFPNGEELIRFPGGDSIRITKDGLVLDASNDDLGD